MTAGESHEEALKREVMEEIGISHFTFKLIGKGIFDRHVLGRHENHYFVLYELFTDELPVLGDEAETYRWFTPTELKKTIKKDPKDFGDAFYFILQKFYPQFLS